MGEQRIAAPKAETLQALQALYTRAHVFVIADLEAAIADNEAVMEMAPSDADLQEMIAMIRAATPLMRERRDSYQRQYGQIVRENDTKAMYQFLTAVRRRHPKFSFTPEELPEP